MCLPSDALLQDLPSYLGFSYLGRGVSLHGYSSKAQPLLQQYVNRELPDVQLVLEKAEEPEIKLPTSTGSLKKQENSRKTSISALLTMTKPLTVDHNKLWKILKEMGIVDHLTCLLINLYAGQEAILRTGHGTIDWFQRGKAVCQGCILSPCLFNLYAE